MQSHGPCIMEKEFHVFFSGGLAEVHVGLLGQIILAEGGSNFDPFVGFLPPQRTTKIQPKLTRSFAVISFAETKFAKKKRLAETNRQAPDAIQFYPPTQSRTARNTKRVLSRGFNRRSAASCTNDKPTTGNRRTARGADAEQNADVLRRSRSGPPAVRGSGPSRPSRGAAPDSGSGDHGEWPRTQQPAQGARAHPCPPPEPWWSSAARRCSVCGFKTRFCVPLLLALLHCGCVFVTCRYCSLRPERTV